MLGGFRGLMCSRKWSWFIEAYVLVEKALPEALCVWMPGTSRRTRTNVREHMSSSRMLDKSKSLLVPPANGLERLAVAIGAIEQTIVGLFYLRRNEAEPTLPALKMVSMLPPLVQICCFVLAGAEAQAPVMSHKHAKLAVAVSAFERRLWLVLHGASRTCGVVRWQSYPFEATSQ
jgi:hypothetical protein